MLMQNSPFYEVPVPGMRVNVKYHRGWGDLDFRSYFAKRSFCNRMNLNLSGKKNWNGKN